MKQTTAKNKVLSCISTGVFILLFVLLCFAVVASLSKKENQISGVFGISFAVVQSGSMIDGGFNVGEVVLIKTANTDTLRVGDIIVFYSYLDNADVPLLPGLNKISANLANGTYQDFQTDASALGRVSAKQAMNAGSMLIFHRIIDVYVDEYGTRFFETKGDSNYSNDNIFVRETFVCAKYVPTSPFVQGAMGFVTSTAGLIVLVVLPILLIAALQCASFAKDLKANKIATSLLRRKVGFGQVDLKNINLDEYLNGAEKAYLFDITAKEHKSTLAQVLWQEQSAQICAIYQKSREDFFEEMKAIVKKSELKHLQKLKIKADIIKQNPTILDNEVDRQAKVVYNKQKEKK